MYIVVLNVKYFAFPFTKVYDRLQILLLCLSRYRTLIYLDHVGETFDKEVVEWKDTVVNSMVASEVITTSLYTFVVSEDIFRMNNLHLRLLMHLTVII